MGNTYGFIYITTNLTNNKKYIGKCAYNRINGWEDYLGSGKILKQAIQKYGRENFKRDIIAEADTREELNALEQFFIAKFNACDDNNYYNIAKGGDGGNTRLGYTEEQYIAYCKKFSKPGELNQMFGKKQSESSKKKNGDKTRDRFLNDEEFKAKHSQAVKEAMKQVDKNKLAYANRSKNVLLKCVICGKEELVYTSQQKACSDCKRKYTKWELGKLYKSLENIC